MPSYSLSELAAHGGCEIVGGADIKISGVGTLAAASTGQVAFLANRKYRKDLLTTQASAVILSKVDAEQCPTHALVATNPYAAWARIASLFTRDSEPHSGIHKNATVATGAKLANGISIGPQAVIGENVSIGEGTTIGPGCVVEANARIGAHTRLVANVSVGEGVQIGDYGLIHPGAVIGSDGFGFAPDGGQWVKVPQLGSVIIADHVEIGANTSIDRGAIEDTLIGEGVKLDNNIQVGHNVSIGAHTVIAGMSGIAGSTEIGKHCMIGGAAGFAGHLTITDGVIIGGRGNVTKSINEPGMYSSIIPVEPERKWRRLVSRFRQLDELLARVKRLEDKNS